MGALPDVTCPGCSSLDWARDCFALHADGPRVDVERLAPAGGQDEPWPGGQDEPWHCRVWA